jgi:2-methylcitrate dehydratase PrpD
VTYAADLADYTSALTYAALPDHIVEKAKTCLLYGLCMGVAGYDADDQFLLGLKAAAGAPGTSTLLVEGERCSAGDAAFINGALLAARGQNDTYTPITAHLGCVVIPAVLAVAEERDSSPREMLAALVAGYEVAAKVGAGAADMAISRGFRATSIFGVFGATAAAGRLIGLSPAQLANAFAFAANFASGVTQCWSDSTMEWRLQVAHASRCGVMAALIAQRGAAGAARAFEGEKGFYRAFSDAVPALNLNGWAMENVIFKPYPGCAFNQGSVHTLISTLSVNGIDGNAVAGVEVVLNPSDLAYPGVSAYGPFAAPSGAIMSLPFMMAVALKDQTILSRRFREWYGPGEVHDLSREIILSPDNSLKPWAARLAIHLHDGRTHVVEFAGPSDFAFGWSETVALLSKLTPEWPLPGAPRRFDQLQRCVSRFGDMLGVKDLLEPCLKMQSERSQVDEAERGLRSQRRRIS